MTVRVAPYAGYFAAGRRAQPSRRRLEATAALREVIDRIVLATGKSRRDICATLHGDLETIFNWIERSGRKDYKPADKASAVQYRLAHGLIRHNAEHDACDCDVPL